MTLSGPTRKMSLVVISEILGQFVNILTASYKYSRPNGKNLLQSIQMQLSKKQKAYSELFALFLKSALNFEHFEIKMSLVTYVFLDLRIPTDLIK